MCLVDVPDRCRRCRYAWLFRGGFLLCGDRHADDGRRGHAPAGDDATGRSASRRSLWVGTRSYGLYLYHWPIYQIIRDIAGNQLKLHEFVVAMASRASSPSSRTASSRRRSARERWARRSPGSAGRRFPGLAAALYGIGVVVGALTLFAGVQPGDGAGRGERRPPDARRGRRVRRATSSPTRPAPGDGRRPIRRSGGRRPHPSTRPTQPVRPSRRPPWRRRRPRRCRRLPIDQLALGDSVMLGAAPRARRPRLHRRRPGEPPVRRTGVAIDRAVATSRDVSATSWSCTSAPTARSTPAI